MKTSCSSLSLPIIRENFRRLWTLPLLAFIAYFLSGVYPILAQYKNPENLPNVVEALLTHNNPFYSMLHLAYPVACAVIVFRYLQSSGSVTVMHALPFTRKSLFCSNALSGLIMTILPVLANGIILMCIAKPLYYTQVPSQPLHYFDAESIPMGEAFDVFSHMNIWNWMWQALLAVILVYLIAVLAGMITGNVLMHLFMAVTLNLLPAGLMLCVGTYLEHFLYGYNFVESQWVFALSPLTGIVLDNGQLPVLWAVLYVIAGILIFLASAILYQKRSLEHTGQSLTFRGIAPVLCILLSFIGMSMMGFFIDSYLEGAGNNIYFGFIIGGVITFIICRMIVMKTLRIFNTASLKNFAAFTVLAAIFICAICFDATGFENRVPKPVQVSSVSLDFATITEEYDRYRSDYFGKAKDSPPDISGENAIGGAIKMHKEIINSRHENNTDSRPNSDTPVYLTYHLKNGKTLTRHYYVDSEFLEDRSCLKEYYESKEFKEYFSLKHLKLNEDKTTSITLDNPWTWEGKSLPKREISQLLNCLEKDFQASTYESLMSKTVPYAQISLTFNEKKISSSETFSDNMTIQVKKDDRNTINWLKAHGYDTFLEPDLAKIKSVTVSKFDQSQINWDDGEYQYDLDQNEGMENPEAYLAQVKIKDKKQIQQILDTCQREQGPYECVFTMESGNHIPSISDCYFTEDTLPDFLAKELK